MRRYVLIFLIGFLPFLTLAQNRLPDYFTVVKKFFSLYHHDDATEARLGFAKKKSGWYVQLTNQYTNKVVSEQLFWSLQKGRYQVLENFVGANTDPLELKVNYFINQPHWYNAVHYARCIYYGYNDWDADIIKDYGTATITNDTLLESLARAYSSYASRFFWYQYGGDSVTSDPLLKKLGRLEMPGADRVKKTQEYIGHAADIYNRILQNNSLYETVIGNIALKTFNEYLHGYLQMTLAERPAEAKWFIDKCRLPVNDSIAAMNLLGSVEANGILFSYGDADTYTTMYLQEKYSLRKDVAIINISLLGLPAYLQYLKKNNIVGFSTTAAEYGSPQIDVLFYQPVAGARRVRPVKDFIAGYSRLKKVPSTGIDSVKVFDTERLFILTPSSDSIAFSLGEYVSMDNFILLDIVSNNFASRPIHFNEVVPVYFEKYYDARGLTSRLMAKEESSDQRAANISNYLRNVYKPPFVHFTNYSAEYNDHAARHVALYMTVLDQAIAKQQKTRADSLVKACFAPFGENLPYLRLPDGSAEKYYGNKYEAIGDKLANTFTRLTLRFSKDQNHYLFYNPGLARANLEKLQSVLEYFKRDTKAVDDALSALPAQ